MTITANGGHLRVSVAGDENWTGEFLLPDSFTKLQPGYYGNLSGFPPHDSGIGGLKWYGEGRACAAVNSWINIDGVEYDGNTLTSIDLRFEQLCQGGAGKLHGEVHWDADDATSAPGPVVPPPADLWQPAAGATPSSGSYVHLESQPGDYIGGGQSHLYTQSDSIITVGWVSGRLSISINGDERWTGDFVPMVGLSRLEPGYYGNLKRRPFHNPARGGMSWFGEGRGCNELTGWFVVDDVTYAGSIITAIDLRFEQHCEGRAPALRGMIRWDVNDVGSPPGPVVPPPPGLWQPAPGITPASGNYVYIESQSGDYIGSGRSYVYTQADSLLTVNASGAQLSVAVNGDERWQGFFAGMNFLSRMEVGYYGDLSDNPVRGRLRWSGDGRACNATTGWFIVDGVIYEGSTITAIDLRFEQHCEGQGPPLRGKIHWDVNDTTLPPGPVMPPPNLWQPAPGTTPANGNYIYLDSQPGDPVGGGRTYLFTRADSLIEVSANGAELTVSIAADESWGGTFQGMNFLTRIEPGYYGDLQRHVVRNPVKGGLDWVGGGGSGCNKLTGWFVVDSVTYEGSAITALTLRFEQHCEGLGPALRGKIRWDARDTTMPPGPVVPPPADLWRPAPGVTPTSGNYIYLDSQPGDYIGAGRSYVYRQSDSQISFSATGAQVEIAVEEDGSWYGTFQGMDFLTRIEAGYYGGLRRHGFHNPVKGGLSWWGQGRACNTVTGWFVVDNVTYVGATLTAIELRFEQHCEGAASSLRGKFRWTQ